MLRIFLILLVGSSILSEISYASPTQIDAVKACANLSQYSCDDQVYNDGTGSAYPLKSLEQKFIQLKRTWEDQHRQEVVAKLTSDTSLRKNIFDSLNASNLYSCRYYFSDMCARRAAEQFFTIISLNNGDPTVSQTTQDYYSGQERNGIRSLPHDAIIAETHVEFLPFLVEQRKSLDAFLMKNLDMTTRRKKLGSDVFPKVREILISVVARLTPDTVEKTEMLKRLSLVEMSDQDCKPEPTVIETLLSVNAEYGTQDHLFRVCNGYLLTTTSEFAMVETIAHELTHSIDSCRIGIPVGIERKMNLPAVVNFTRDDDGNLQSTLAKYPLSKSLSCLIDTNSLLPGDSDVFFAIGKALNPNLVLPGFFCQHNHQSNEVFPDLIAAEVVAEYMALNHKNLKQNDFLNGYANAFKGLCSAEDKKDMKEKRSDAKKFGSAENTHPDLQLRINQILLSNKNVRQEMGCAQIENPTFKDCVN